ncbi:hypothetical protein [Pseudomonas savastanoi]|uniref:hypothetical protein n=1 Tax=Pseudomonas savastanoi TaxID=29438 RepID=UPI001EE720F8|nr:hypothetical protein [Pseudomonas savastanoi]
MSHPPFQQALTEAELDRLTGFLDAIGSPAMNIEMLDGYFAALICGRGCKPESQKFPSWARSQYWCGLTPNSYFPAATSPSRKLFD